jgi:hypothetical protein
MKNIMTTQNLMFLGIGLATAFIAFKFLENRDKASTTTPTTKPSDKTETASSFCGCGA